MYWPGKEMLLADALSHLPSRANNSEIKLDLRVDAISISAFSSSRLTKTAQEMQKDPILLTVHWLTLNGWPRVWRHVPRIAHNYWDFRDELSIEGDLLMKGERIVIPTNCRDSILADLHKSHEGANRSLSLARTCMYWPGMEADMMDYIKWCVTCIDNAKMPVETLHPHEVPAGPWIKVGMDFFQDDSGQKIFDHCRLFLQVPIHLSCHIGCWDTWEICFHQAYHLLWWLNGPPFNGFKRFAIDFKHQTSSPHFHQSNGFIRPWWRRWKLHIRRQMDLQTLKLEPCCSCMIHQLQKICHHQQRYYMDGLHKELSCPQCHRPINIPRIHQCLLEIQNHQKEHFDRVHRAKDERVLKVKEQVRFFPQKQYGTKLKWLTGTVREILEWGHSYIIEGPNRKKYRRNRAHLKPLCHDGSSFQDPPEAKKKNLTKSDNLDSFQDPRPRQKKSVTFQNYPLIFESIPNWDTANKMSNPTSHSSHCVQHFSPHSPSSSPPAHLSSREKLVSPNAEDHIAPKHQTIIQPQDMNTQLTSGLAALVQETSPIAPYKIQCTTKRKARQILSNMF